MSYQMLYKCQTAPNWVLSKVSYRLRSRNWLGIYDCLTYQLLWEVFLVKEPSVHCIDEHIEKTDLQTSCHLDFPLL